MSKELIEIKVAMWKGSGEKNEEKIRKTVLHSVWSLFQELPRILTNN